MTSNQESLLIEELDDDLKEYFECFKTLDKDIQQFLIKFNTYISSYETNDLIVLLSELESETQLGKGYLDVFTKLKNVDSSRYGRLLLNFKNLISYEEVNQVVWELSGVRTDSNENSLTREIVLDRIRRYINISNKNFRKQNFKYLPEVEKGMIVEVSFTGIGGEHDKKHKAIVWDVDPNRDNILVLPTTSLKEDKKFYKHYFSIGKVGFLPKDTVVMLDQAISVSHKRILDEKYRNPSSNDKEKVFISPEQEQRINDGIRVTYLGEHTLASYLLNNFRNFIPIVRNLAIQFGHLLRPFVLIDNNPETLTYSLKDDLNTKYSIDWYPSSVSKNQRDRLLRNWIEAIGEQERDPNTGQRTANIIKRRRDTIQEKFNDLNAAVEN